MTASRWPSCFVCRALITIDPSRKRRLNTPPNVTPHQWTQINCVSECNVRPKEKILKKSIFVGQKFHGLHLSNCGTALSATTSDREPVPTTSLVTISQLTFLYRLDRWYGLKNPPSAATCPPRTRYRLLQTLRSQKPIVYRQRTSPTSDSK